MELIIVVILISVIIFVLRMLLRGGGQQQQQQEVVVVQSNPVSQPSQNSGDVFHNVTYNIHDSVIAGDINTGLNKQDDWFNQLSESMSLCLS